jgi:hypothetical protein
MGNDDFQIDILCVDCSLGDGNCWLDFMLGISSRYFYLHL